MRTNVVAAIFKRNFVSYFSSPIGYVFICALVLMTAFAAFWPNDFFNANLANLDQLNRRIPWIMLVFIPAVTMSVWASERERGTDELLLTLPARDFDVVIGKYLATLAIFTVALGFSGSNVVVLVGLGTPDFGLIAANYIGYWLMGAALLSVRMTASFLTSNLTVAFILAIAFNAPLVFASYADVIHGRELARAVKQFGIAGQFRDFSQGVISLSGVLYFASIAVVMLYVSVVLIRRRLWAGRRAAVPLGLHYTIRVLALMAMVAGLTVLGTWSGGRVDATSERLSSLCPQTLTLLNSLNDERPVYIDAYISPTVPERYVQTRATLLNILREIDSIARDRVIVRIRDTEVFSEFAVEAQEQFGIMPRSVQSTSSGKFEVEAIFLGVAFMCGLDKVVVPFFDSGIPVEYEVVRSVATVSQQTRRRIGIVTTDARLFGGFDIQTMSTRPNEQIIAELNKQYETEQVSPAAPIGDFDALLVVQPSTLPQAQLDNVMDAIRRGIPTAIFEDPFPVQDDRVAATSAPRVQPGANNLFQQQRPPLPAKGDIQGLWDLLQVRVDPLDVVWEDYNPYPKLPDMPRELVFIGSGSGTPDAFNPSHDVTSGLQQVLLMFGGTLRQLPGSTLAFTPLLTTGARTGLISYNDMRQRSIFGAGALDPARRHTLTTGTTYTMAAHITGPVATGEGTINVILATDIDMLYSMFFNLRRRGTGPDEPLDLKFDNVTLVLNMLDYLAGDDRFIEIRKRRPVHRTLTRVAARTQGIIDQANQEAEQFQTDFDRKQAEQQTKFALAIQRLQNRPGVDLKQMTLEVQAAVQTNDRQMQTISARLGRERDREIQRTERSLALEIRRIQDGFKFAAVVLPPILPIMLAVFVYARRRRMERVGVPAARIRNSMKSMKSMKR